MRSRRATIATWMAIAIAATACSPGTAAGDRDTATPSALPSATRDISRAEAIHLARDYVVRQRASALVYVDSVRAEAVDSLWRVTFRRRALVAPAVLTVDVHRRTGVVRFPGDE